MKILVADDDIVSRTLVEKLLEKMGYTVLVCVDGHSALQHMLEADAPRLAILDWMMPGLDGPDVIRRIRAESEAYPYLILLTNRTETTDKVEGLESGADDYLVKPLNAGELQARVHVGIRFLNLQDLLDQKSKTLIRLEREQRQASLAKMAGGVAHLLNNKLQAVISFLDLMRMQFHESNLLDPEQESILFRTRVSAMEAADIGKKMLAYLSKNIGKPEPVNVKQVCEGARQDLSDEFPVMCTWKPNDELNVRTMANPEDLRQVFYQVLLNALEANPRQVPDVTLVIRDEPLAQDAPGSQASLFPVPEGKQKLRMAHVRIRDHGPGIPYENLGKIFEPFFSTKFTGRGLGLPVAMGILKKIGGRIRVECPAEGGTCVEISLPLLP
jgi:DNA-binding response OmpR family regulator